MQTAVAAIGRQLDVISAVNSSEIDAAFALFAQKRIEALVIGTSPVFSNRRAQFVLQTTPTFRQACSPLR